MNRVVSVDKSLIAGGTQQWFVTMDDGTRIQVTESQARQFEKQLLAQASESGQQLLTETHP
ncbi:MAG: hypothetical protein AB7L09_03310 [Nitrospira sp.]